MRKTRQSLSPEQEEILAKTERFWMGVLDRRMLSRMDLRIPRDSAIVLQKTLRMYQELELEDLLKMAEDFTGRNIDEHRGATSGHHVLTSEKTMGELASRAKITQEFHQMVEEDTAKAKLNALRIFWISSVKQRKSRGLSIAREVLFYEAKESGNLKGISDSEAELLLESLKELKLL